MHPVARADRGRAAHGGARREHREPLHEQPFRSREQVPAPLHHGSQGAVPGQGGAAAAGEQPEPVGQPRGDLGQRQGAQPRRGQLDRQRQAVQPAHDLDHGRDRRLVDGEIGADGGCPVGEQAGCGEPEHVGDCHVRGGLGQGRHREQHLADDAQRLAAGGQDPQQRTPGEQQVGQARDSVEKMLAVVQHDDGRSVGESLDQPADRVATDPFGGLVQQVRLAQTERAQDGLRHVGRFGDGGQLDEPHPVGNVVHDSGQRFAGKAGLTGAARPDECDQPARLERRRDARHLVVTADEARQLRAQVRAPAPLRGPRPDPLTPQDRQLHRPQLGGRVDAQLVGQPDPKLVVAAQRVGLAAGGGQRGHQLTDQPFVQRVLGGQRLELTDDLQRAARRQVDLHAVENGAQMRLAQSGRMRRNRRDGRAAVGLGERGPAPQRESGAQRGGRAVRVAGAQGAGTGGGEQGETVDVDVVGIDGQAVPGGRPGDQCPVAEATT